MLYFMFQFSLGDSVKVRWVDLDESVDELGDKIGFEFRVLSVGPA